jgi:hypothetical protein
MLTDRDSLLRKLHELRSEHRDLDTVIARIAGNTLDQLQLQRLKKRKLMLKDEVSWLGPGPRRRPGANWHCHGQPVRLGHHEAHRRHADAARPAP